MRVFVTGASGFVGTHLTARLKGLGYEVHPFDSATNPANDIRDYDSVRRGLDHCQPDLIFHLAALAYVPESTTDTRRAFNVNTLGTINLMEAIRQSGSDARVLVTGTSEEYGYEGHEGVVTEETRPNPKSLYGISKLAAGLSALNYSERYGMPVVVTRAVNHTGPGHQRTYAVPAFARRVAMAEKYGHPVTHGNLESSRYYLGVQDVVSAYLRAIELDSGTYNVGTDTSVTLQFVLDTLIGMAKTDVVTAPAETLYRSVNVHVPLISSARFREATGWEPVTPLEDTLRDTLDYWRRHV